MGRFHTHADGTVHAHDAAHEHGHDHDGRRDVGDHAGYTETGTVRIEVLEQLLAENDRVADANRERLRSAGVRTVNVMSSPGAGKTTLLRETLIRLGPRVRIGIVEGDIATSIDADRLAGLADAVSLVNTGAGFGGECHLDAVMVRHGLAGLPLGDLDLVLIENVGNLVCPAEFDVGEDAKVMVFAVTEGEDKPLKYPVMFRSCELVLVNKVDLLPHLEFDLAQFLETLRHVNPGAEVLLLSAQHGDGIDGWCHWLEHRITGRRATLH
jgi:hydrogenase nickel incorporation protein HypB